MNAKLILKCALPAILMLATSGCLTRRTVSQGGNTVESKYVFKRPLKEAIQNSR